MNGLGNSSREPLLQYMRLVAGRRSQDTVRHVSSKERGGVAISVTESEAPNHR